MTTSSTSSSAPSSAVKTRLSRRWHTPLMAALGLILGLVVAFLVAELCLRLWVKPPTLLCGWDPTSRPQGERNQLGMRGRFLRKKEEAFVIVMLGDSQVVAEALAFEQMPARLLQRQLHLQGKTRVEVRSLAGIGWGQAEQLLALRRYFRAGFRADMVLLWFTRENDVWNNIFPAAWGHPHYPKPTYWLSGGALRGPLCVRGAPPPRTHVQRWWQNVRSRHLDKRWNSWLPPATKPLPPGSKQYPANETLSKLFESNHWPARDEQPFFNKSHWLLRISPRSPRVEYGIRLTNKLLRSLERESRRNRASFLIFTAEPALGTRYLFGRNFKKRERWLWRGHSFQTTSQQWDQNWKEISKGLLSLSLRLRTLVWRVSRQDAHLNLVANREAMRLLAHQIQGFVLQKKRRSVSNNP